jgi:hypothetical protein
LVAIEPRALDNILGVTFSDRLGGEEEIALGDHCGKYGAWIKTIGEMRSRQRLCLALREQKKRYMARVKLRQEWMDWSESVEEVRESLRNEKMWRAAAESRWRVSD